MKDLKVISIKFGVAESDVSHFLESLEPIVALSSAISSSLLLLLLSLLLSLSRSLVVLRSSWGLLLASSLGLLSWGFSGLSLVLSGSSLLILLLSSALVLSGALVLSSALSLCGIWLSGGSSLGSVGSSGLFLSLLSSGLVSDLSVRSLDLLTDDSLGLLLSRERSKLGFVHGEATLRVVLGVLVWDFFVVLKLLRVIVLSIVELSVISAEDGLLLLVELVNDLSSFLFEIPRLLVSLADQRVDGV